MRSRNTLRVLLLAGAGVCSLIPAWTQGQVISVPHPRSGETVTIEFRASNVIIPQARAFSIRQAVAPAEITGITANVGILEQVATTTMDVQLRNPSGSRIEAELIVPVPDAAAVRGFSFEGSADEPTARILPKDEAKRTYDSIVAKVKDPALLEFIGYNLIRSSVFPLEANGTQTVRLIYEQILSADGDRIDYVLPRSESLTYSVPWNVSVTIKSKQPISTVYSPSHNLETARRGADTVSVCIARDATTVPGPFRLSYLLQRDGVTASLLAYPDAKVGGGYFLLLAGLPAQPPNTGDEPAIKRAVTLVLDRSGSMNGEKIEQVREAALQVVSGLEQGESFNIVTYNDSVNLFSARPVLKNKANVRKAREYLNDIQARGGTNIHAALTEALNIRPQDKMLPIVLFLTDGLPTVGNTSEIAIREVAMKANPYQQRIFTFGVGVDVNTPLLEKIALETRATATFVLPGEDVELKVAQVFKRLAGPVLADAKFEVIGPNGHPAPGRVRDLLPAQLPDLFEDDQLVLLGQYLTDKPLNFRVSGNYLGKERTFSFNFKLDNATTRNAFVPRLWASRKIAVLVDAIRQLGANGNTLTAGQQHLPDPKLKELVDEIVRLSTEFGILTEYTAFLADEGNDLSDPEVVFTLANGNFIDRAMNTRTGLGAVNQAFNNDFMRAQAVLNWDNGIYDANMNRVSVTNVQQINDSAFYRRNGRWVDSRLVNTTTQPARVVKFGSQEFNEMAEELARQGRQGSLSLDGEKLILYEMQPVLVE